MRDPSQRTSPSQAAARPSTYALRWQPPHHVAVCDCGWVSDGMTTPGMAGSSWDAHDATTHGGASTDDIVVVGPPELDAATAEALRALLADAFADGSHRGPVVLDLVRTTFIDASGLGVIVWFANAGERLGRPTLLRHPDRKATWLLDLTGVADRFAAPRRWPALLP